MAVSHPFLFLSSSSHPFPLCRSCLHNHPTNSTKSTSQTCVLSPHPSRGNSGMTSRLVPSATIAAHAVPAARAIAAGVTPAAPERQAIHQPARITLFDPIAPTPGEEAALLDDDDDDNNDGGNVTSAMHATIRSSRVYDTEGWLGFDRVEMGGEHDDAICSLGLSGG
ncbi:hypothetical protein BDY17DRAFT_288596 [Neohortaea acidophila]|uniref:Uncharacterized protein n=1 Tax=Neohortaea acidophila TaxID=245834 RepID=A0A6A6Q5L7_9PEZI|nr:uncharacterized protein BDY17DRAFT_288596 [Neohortaea acidophila]KAF2487246.1 hypothetical protein BDY17DRAFT_288596 [Neohortaea acidophila]